ncbi:MAG: YggS family pyridoxal phosphate-dependent enzyme, partial [Candidatus Aminicenantes bacterium]|nr:YggS family pyridoxal phosphate-dependent enzyme [Candidatus Aminicenantes bacterium]
MSELSENINTILKELPEGVELVAAAKTRTVDEVQEAIKSGVKIIGENYIQEAEEIIKAVGNNVRWHFIGHLQRNKVKKAIELFDMIETVDSHPLAKEIDKHSRKEGKIMPILIEINSGREPQKDGVLPENAVELIQQISEFENIKIQGLMTMGPFSGDPEDARPYFVETRKIFEQLKSMNLSNVTMRYLSMGMTNSYQVAIEEG